MIEKTDGSFAALLISHHHHPQARLPGPGQPSPNSSLTINNLALKYLSDAELCQLAATYQHNNNSGNSRGDNSTDKSRHLTVCLLLQTSSPGGLS